MPAVAAHPTDSASRRSATVLALCLPSDVLLYLLLPMNTQAFGVTLAQAGVLLAANRLVRIFGYSYVLRYYARHGDRSTLMLAAGASAFCALGNSLISGFGWLLLLRLVWGLAFAAMNLSTQVLATLEPSGAARRAGRSRGVIAIGPMIALSAGGWLSLHFGPRLIFLLLCGAHWSDYGWRVACRQWGMNWRHFPGGVSNGRTVWRYGPLSRAWRWTGCLSSACVTGLGGPGRQCGDHCRVADGPAVCLGNAPQSLGWPGGGQLWRGAYAAVVLDPQRSGPERFWQPLADPRRRFGADSAGTATATGGDPGRPAQPRCRARPGPGRQFGVARYRCRCRPVAGGRAVAGGLGQLGLCPGGLAIALSALGCAVWRR